MYYIEPKSMVIGGVANVAHHLTKALAKKVNVAYFPRFIPKRSYLVNLLGVYGKFMTKDFHIIHFNVFPALNNGSFMLLKLANIKRIPKVLNIHGITQLEHKLEPAIRPKSAFNLFNITMSCNQADRVVVNSEYMRANVATMYRVNPEKILVIPNGVDTKSFYECDKRLVLEGDPSILYLGILSRMKGVDVLIQAVAKLCGELPDLRLHLLGPGHLRSFRLLAEKRGVEKNVIFHGWVAHSTVPSYYKSADICVVPSRHEGFGITILEAMASGIPVIASDIGSFREILSNGINGILFKSEDADLLSESILTLCRDADLRKRISHNALKTVTRYSWENIAEEYISLYRCLCK